MNKIFLAIFALCFFVLLWSFSIDIGDYPNLNTCLKTSISKKTLCSKSSNYVQLKNISDYFLKAVVMSEDDKFYFHEGFDWKELRKSMAANLRQFSFVRGGSTITQQLVKNVYLNREKTISRKIVEARLAKKIENEHPKKLILEKYVNAIEFGENLWGIKQASEFYFKKSPRALDPLESLYLVILLPSPIKYSKTFFEKKLSHYQKRRMDSLLRRMKRRSIISEKEYAFYKDSLRHFFKKSEPYKEEPVWAEDIEDAEVILPEKNEMQGDEMDDEGEDLEVVREKTPVEETDTSDWEDVDTSLEHKNTELKEESFEEEDGVVEDIEPDLGLDEDSAVIEPQP